VALSAMERVAQQAFANAGWTAERVVGQHTSQTEPVSVTVKAATYCETSACGPRKDRRNAGFRKPNLERTELKEHAGVSSRGGRGQCNGAGARLLALVQQRHGLGMVLGPAVCLLVQLGLFFTADPFR
jgi:hypothetical protein